MTVAVSMPGDSRRRAVQRRRLTLAVLASLLLHAPLFVPLGGWHFGLQSEDAAPTLAVHIEPEPEPELAPATEEPIEELAAAEAPQEPLEEIAATELAAVEAPVLVTPPPIEQPAPLEPATASAPPAPAEPPVASASPPPPHESSALEDAIPPAVSPEPGVDTPAAGTAPTGAAEPSIEPVVATTAPAEQRVLTRRMLHAARELLGSRTLQSSVSFEHDEREYTAALVRQPATDGTGIERVTVEISTELDGERVQTSLEMKRLAFSHFTQFVDHWDPGVQLHDDEIAGRFHSNSDIVVGYDRRVAPRLLGKVTTARGVRMSGESGWHSRRKIFVGGVETRTPRVMLPEIALPVAHARATRDADVHVVRADTRLVFHADGGIDALDMSSGSIARWRISPGRPAFVVGTRGAELHVRGTVAGRVTVYSPRRIVVEDDLTYAHDPRTDGAAGDFLGLVSDGNVEIAPQEITGPGDLAIFAAIYARKRFVVRGIGRRNRGTLYVHGSLTAGSLSATEPRYATRMEFDSRLERARPPGFPETDRYELEAWDGRWRLAEAPPGR